MIEKIPILVLIPVLLYSCAQSPNKVTSDGVPTPRTADGKDPYMGDMKAMPKQLPNENDESIIPPSQITGAYLACEEIPDGRLSTSEKKVGCSFQDVATGSNIDLAARYRSHRWGFESFAPIQASIAEHPAGERFQALFLLSAARPDLLVGEQFLDFKLITEDDFGNEQDYQTTLSTQFAKWVALNGKVAPKEAIAGGSEENGNVGLQICRIRVGDVIVPGKVRNNGNSSAVRTVCYAAWKGVYYESNSFGADQIVNQTDILVMNQLQFDDVLEWVPMENGKRPDNAFTGGVDEDDRPVFICRALENGDGIELPAGKPKNKADGEYSPGVLAEDGSACEYEYFGPKTKAKYQILAWKSAKLKALMDAVALAKGKNRP